MLLLIDKPSGITSHDTISAVKKSLRQPARDALSDEDKWAGMKPPKIKIWHAGTLDPLASGLMIAATDSDTKQLHTLTGHDKIYEAVIDFSQSSDTRDMDYRKELKPVDISVYKTITLDQIKQKLDSIIGTHDLPLTPFSAKKVHGKKLYEYAREWKAIFLTVPMTLLGYEVIEYAFPLLRIHLHVGTGTYIRSIAHRLGTEFGGNALLSSLRRTHIADYSLSAITKNPKHTTMWDDKHIEYIIL